MEYIGIYIAITIFFMLIMGLIWGAIIEIFFDRYSLTAWIIDKVKSWKR